MKKLYAKVLDAVHGQAIIKTPFGEYRGIGIDTWIETVYEAKQIAAWQILAVILLYFGIPARPISKEEEELLFLHWLAELNEAARKGVVTPYHQITLLRMTRRPVDFDWIIPLEMADAFMVSVGHDTKISEVVERLYKEYLLNINGQSHTDSTTKKIVESQEKPLRERERNSLYNIIGSLLACLNHHGVDEAAVKAFLDQQRYTDFDGVSTRNLEKVFPLARKSIGG
ncbi:hypothetical protein KW843_09965 [Acidovorax sp. sif1233]|uniref:hypothetical protein n=1 Tax=Acidovorax sp. sif1233 TaxID=2854792 RepID=UPI001C446D16|nr:hypothetical protein [Acidovorax sp. sif1233]MBV7454796.1 hypothetical protein [Acidovorax sp. sif1233]